MQSCNPLIKWPGGKRSELSIIEPRVPKHTRYFEPFFGGGSVYFGLINAEAYVNDIHPDLVGFYQCVKNRDESFSTYLYQQIEKWEASSAEERNTFYYDCRARYNSGVVEPPKRAVDFFLLRELAYGGMFRVNAQGAFNVPFGRAYAYNKNLRSKVRYAFSPEVQSKMEQLHLFSLDFADFLGLFEFHEGDFMFVDPPYDTSFTKYDKNEFNQQDQERLAEALTNFQGKFLMVCKATPLIESLYGTNINFQIIHYDHQYKFNIKGRFSRSTTHAMITNYH